MQINRQGSLSVTAANASGEPEAGPAKARLWFMIPGPGKREKKNHSSHFSQCLHASIHKQKK